MQYYDLKITGPYKRWAIGWDGRIEENQLFLLDNIWLTKNPFINEYSVYSYQVFASEEDAIIASLNMLKLSANKFAEKFSEINKMEQRLEGINKYLLDIPMSIEVPKEEYIRPIISDTEKTIFEKIQENYKSLKFNAGIGKIGLQCKNNLDKEAEAILEAFPEDFEDRLNYAYTKFLKETYKDELSEEDIAKLDENLKSMNIKPYEEK